MLRRVMPFRWSINSVRVHLSDCRPRVTTASGSDRITSCYSDNKYSR